MKLITPDTIAFNAQISEDELRERLAFEVLGQIDALDVDGKPLPGIEWKVLRGKGAKAGYTIEVKGPAPARIAMLAKGGDT